jgi:hypothetical protein
MSAHIIKEKSQINNLMMYLEFLEKQNKTKKADLKPVGGRK